MYKNKIVHFFKYEKFTKDYINFINNSFKDEHFFIVFGDKEGFSLDFSEYINVKEINSYFIDLGILKKCYQAKSIILHSLLCPKLLIELFFMKGLVKKTTILFWGADLYYYNIRNKSIKKRIYEIIRKSIIKHAKQILTLVKGDYDLAKKWYGIEGTYYDCKYYSPNYSREVLEKLNRIADPEIVNIQIGNSATQSNHHIEVLMNLKKFSEENIHIYLPLSYGDFNYRDEVEKVAKEWFGEKVTIMKEFYKPEIFNQHLANMDIAIFNNDRQQALGNIYMLICLKAKVYMRSDTSMWDEMTNILGCQLEDVKQIEQETFKAFIKKENNILEKNSKIIKKYNSLDYAKEIWTKIFEA